MVQVVKMSDEEKFEMYMNTPHEDLVRMKIEEEKYVEQLEQQVNPQSYFYTLDDVDKSVTTFTSTEN